MTTGEVKAPCHADKVDIVSVPSSPVVGQFVPVDAKSLIGNSDMEPGIKNTRDLDTLLSNTSQPPLKKKSSSSSGRSTKKTTATKLRKQSSKKRPPDADMDLAAIGGRDTSLFLFRALGKILYCKRGDPDDYPDQPTLPEHLSHCYRDPLLIHPEDIVEKAQLSGDFFTAYLHQNYLDFYVNIDDVVTASEYLSDADHLTTDWACRRNKEAARDLFSVNCWTPEELFMNYLPYLNLLKVHLRKPGQMSFIQEMSKFGGKQLYRGNSEQLDENDVALLADDDDYDESSSMPHTNVSASQGQPEGQTAAAVTPDEDIVIEDFDD